jgi:hypothetical protein
LNEYWEAWVECNSPIAAAPDFRTTIVSPVPWASTRAIVKDGQIIEAKYDLFGLGGKATRETTPEEGGQKGVVYLRHDIWQALGRHGIVIFGRRRQVAEADLTVQQRAFLRGTTVIFDGRRRHVPGYPGYSPGVTPIYKVDTIDVEFAKDFLSYFFVDIKEIKDKKREVVVNLTLQDRTDLEGYVSHINEENMFVDLQLQEARTQAYLGAKVGTFTMGRRAPGRGLFGRKKEPDLTTPPGGEE